MEEYPQVAKGGRVSIGSQGEEYPQVAKVERISTSGKGEVYPPMAKHGWYPQGDEAYISQ